VRREHVYQCVIVPDGEGGVGDVVGEAHDGGGVGGIEQHWVIDMVISERHRISRSKGTESEAEESCDKESGGLHDGGGESEGGERERERCAGGEGRRERGRASACVSAEERTTRVLRSFRWRSSPLVPRPVCLSLRECRERERESDRCGVCYCVRGSRKLAGSLQE